MANSDFLSAPMTVDSLRFFISNLNDSFKLAKAYCPMLSLLLLSKFEFNITENLSFCILAKAYEAINESLLGRVIFS